MAIKNYTTAIPVEKTISEIHVMLVQHGAKRLTFDYTEDNHLSSICFSINTPYGEQGVKLPANVERIHAVLVAQKKEGRNKAAIDTSYEQAERVAWRITKDWLAANLALLESAMVEITEVFLPYFVDRSGKTLYEAYIEGKTLIGGPDNISRIEGE